MTMNNVSWKKNMLLSTGMNTSKRKKNPFHTQNWHNLIVFYAESRFENPVEEYFTWISCLCWFELTYVEFERPSLFADKHFESFKRM